MASCAKREARSSESCRVSLPTAVAIEWSLRIPRVCCESDIGKVSEGVLLCKKMRRTGKKRLPHLDQVEVVRRVKMDDSIYGRN